ncbi:hypothetical protein HMPREF1624_07126 [Sporothrix schenckii ATCC 58251]|uniref:Carboxylic ester hydrolase n=1 Tax=Sporothrix schenckii (strain ATCC 58251 / de Perez 2211183) TaxID=1391915 RepID=U7PKX5_SPOS1|nr:hypothetical protein HMPREF1624_07126 [Sporothrix schenckii ATCC 58251]
MASTLLALLATAAAVSAQGGANQAPATNCAALKAPTVGNATVVSLQAATRNAVPVRATNGTRLTVSLCDVNVTLTHGNTRDRVRVQVWLPLGEGSDGAASASAWNGRFQATGGSGFQAGLFDAALGPAVADGYAAASTDAGVGTMGSFPVQANTTSALTQQLFTNFASLSVHEMAVVGKALVEQLYGKPAAHSYFTGCSTGGRQGYMEAQRYPADFDGILAASPAINWDRLLAAMLWPFSALQQQFPLQPDGSGTKVPPCVLDAFQGGVVSACDALDGVTDGIVTQPGACKFDPTTLVGKAVACSSAQGGGGGGGGGQRGQNGSATSVTITNAHAAVFSKILAGPASPDGKALWYGLLPGASPTTLASTTQNGTAPFSLAATWLNNFVLALNDPRSNFSSFGASMPAAHNRLAKKSADTTAVANVQAYTNIFQQSQSLFDVQIGTDNPDLRAFQAAGGKLLSWHGLADQLVFPNGTLDYLQRTIDLLDANAVDSFYRVFVAPGVQHCGGGPGAAPSDPLASLVQWVENNKAPDTLPARKAAAAASNSTVAANSTSAAITRNLCRYPQMMVYGGSGDGSQADNWKCVAGPNQQVIAQKTASQTTPLLAVSSGVSNAVSLKAGVAFVILVQVLSAVL